MRRVLALVVLVSLPRVALADPAPVTAIPPGDDRITVLRQGEPAPYTGQLFDSATSLRWGNWLEQYKLRLKTDVEYQKKIDAAEIEYQKKIIELDQQKYQAVTVELQKKLDQATSPPFYSTVWFGVVIGAVLMGTAVGLAAWGMSAVK